MQHPNKISINNLNFLYEKDKKILNNVSLEISKGSSIAFIGESGSGKSTLVDVIIGLHDLDDNLYIDDYPLNLKNLQSWREKIGYIPQNINLFEGTVAENVAFSKYYDEIRVKKALEQAKLLEFLEKEHNGIDTLAGDSGIKLSGGQRQRVAIARALYTDPEILVLDEATSALDTNTEADIMKEIYEISKGKTLIIIAHRLSTIKKCDKVYEIKNGFIFERKDLKGM